MNAYVIYTSILAAALSGLAPAQTHPNFSGVWSVSAIRPAPSSGRGVGALPPSDLTIRQDAMQFSTSRSAVDQVITATFDLTGHESTDTLLQSAPQSLLSDLSNDHQEQ